MTNNRPFFTVVIPTYERANFIRKTIESVLGQSRGDFEVIVVDDGGDDGTRYVVAEIADARVTYVWQENGERAAARNAGTARAKGEYVTFLDSDDLLYPDHLAVAFEIAMKHDRPEWFHLGYEFVDQGGRTSRAVDALPPIANERLTDGNFLSCRGVFVRKDVALSHLFNTDRELSGTEDYELWLRLASRFSLYCDNRITSAIVQHDERSVVNTDRAKLEKRIELLEKYLAADDEFMHRYAAAWPAFQANNRVYIALHLALTKRHPIAAIGYLLKALACSPLALRNRAFYGTLKRLVV